MTGRNKGFWNGRRALVTGHEGFLGSWLTKTLVEEGADVLGVDRVKDRPLSILNDMRDRVRGVQGDIADCAFVKSVISMFRPTVIFHLAAQAIVGEANRDPIGTFSSNIEGTWNILENCRGKKYIEGIVVASSDKAYGSHAKLPYKEEAPLQGEHPYDVSKSCADLICRSYYVSFGVPVCVTRCGNIYGPGDYNFSRLIPDAIRHILAGKQFVIRSDGRFTRDYIFVKDVVDGYMVLAENLKRLKVAGEAFNFSGERPLSVLEVFKALQKVCGGKNVRPKILNQARHEIKHQYLSSSKAKKILGWKAQYRLNEVLKETVDWYRYNLPAIN